MSLLRCWSGPVLRRYRMLVVATVLALCLLGALSWALYAESSPSLADPAENDPAVDRRKYGIVIDAGSSGSRVMIYAWDDPTLQQRENRAGNDDAKQPLGLPAIERASMQWTYKTSPGISSFADRPQRVGAEHIRPLLDFAQQHIPRRQIRHTPVYLLATAGMRLLPQSRQSQILDDACSFARANYGFLLPDCQEGFQVVSGELEGLYGWVAVNYLMGGFATAGKDSRSFGFLDMGGASAQIAFEPAKAAAKLHQHDLAEVTLRSLDGSDFSHHVFVATFLGHGTNEARRRYVDILRARATAGEGAQLPVVDDPCLAVGLTLPTTDSRAALRGTGHFADCVAATEPLLNNTACPIEPCLFAGVHAPEIDFGTQRFVGVSEYWYASHDYLGLGGMWDVEKFEAQASQFCQLSWAEAIQQHRPSNDGSSDSAVIARLQMQCFKAAWLVNVLHNGFGVPRGMATPGVAGKVAHPAPFQSVNQVGDVEVSWTLGALLLKVSRTIPPNSHTLKAKSSPGIRLPDNPGVDEGDVELKDDSLWSPLQFVGIRRLLVLWSLQPTTVRVVLALVMLGACILLVGLLYWLISATLYRRLRRPIGSGAPSPIPMEPLVVGRYPQLSPSQLGLAEYSAYDRAREYEKTLRSELRRTPSMFFMDLFSRPLLSASNDATTTSLPSSPAGEYAPDQHSSPLHFHRSLSSAVAAEMSPISRSSSVVNLSSPSRRRGGGGGDITGSSG
ncbi:Golgi apyrase [Coemansia sp. S3946]|nr:Golgi apyrase [Coemansia sp. S3946]